MIKIYYILALIATLFFYSTYAQVGTNVIGTYVKPSNVFPSLKESISLLPDSTFIYNRKGKFTHFEIKGKWFLIENSLYLSSFDSSDIIMQVQESFSTNLDTSFALVKVRYQNNVPPNFSFIINDEDKFTAKEYNDGFDSMMISKHSLRTITLFTIIKYPTYYIRDCQSNIFDFVISSNKVMKNERWFLIGDKIIPIQLDGEYTHYFLMKENQ